MSLLSHFLGQTKSQISKGAKQAFNLDELFSRKAELPMLKFGFNKSERNPEIRNLDGWLVGSDGDIGGKSEAKLELTKSGTGLFYGNLSGLPLDHLEVQVPSYAAIKSKTRDNGLYGEQLWDTMPFRYLALRVKGSNGENGSPPNRNFTVNVKTDGYIPADLFQHRLFLNTPGKWETVLIPFQEFVLTNDGYVEPHQMTMFREKVESIGIGLLDSQPGPFQLEIDWIKAINTQFTDGDCPHFPDKVVIEN